ncbi:MAG: ribonuclease HII [Bdellovibrionales bacterium]|nr:ribonuclease HII [Bdellovibrionales bacterium]
MSSGYSYVAGVDEVGRGAIAGPVVVAAVIMDPQKLDLVGQLRDSKKISAKKRESLYDLIQDQALAIGLSFIDHQVIDQINILQATLMGMKKAVSELDPCPSICLVDGNQKFHSHLPQHTIVKGDDRVFTIAAASIIAKVARDRWMIKQDALYPEYGFISHKGYGTQFHRQAIFTHGQTPIHRKSFVLKESNNICLKKD